MAVSVVPFPFSFELALKNSKFFFFWFLVRFYWSLIYFQFLYVTYFTGSWSLNFIFEACCEGITVRVINLFHINLVVSISLFLFLLWVNVLSLHHFGVGLSTCLTFEYKKDGFLLFVLYAGARWSLISKCECFD